MEICACGRVIKKDKEPPFRSARLCDVCKDRINKKNKTIAHDVGRVNIDLA